MTTEPVRKPRLSQGQRLLRLLKSILDPRAIGHMFKIVNFYNTTHVAELRQAQKGRGLRISPTASFANGRNIVLGDRVHIGAGCYVWGGPGRGRVVLGDDVLMAPGVMLTAANYRFNDGGPVTEQAMDEADIIIGRDVWLGYGVVVLPGVTIGDGAIVGAGTVVRKNLPAGAIAVGNPARIVGQRSQKALPPGVNIT
jgi:acetyltransferase-like isoleucine patch superfamily enzyme